MEEIKDIAMWEETDSELAKYKIQALNSLVNSYKKQNEFFEASIKHIEQVNKELFDRINKAIEYINKKWEEEHYYEDIDNCMTFCDYDKEDLLDILRGDEK